ncbi:MAG: RNA polymerase sigma factor [Agarilytica sp.]
MDPITLIKAAQQGDALVFEQLVEMYYDDIYRIAYSWCGQKSDAEDIAQNACIKLGQGIRQYQFNSKFSTWLYRLVINCAKDWQRQNKHNNEEIEENNFIDNSVAEMAIYLRQILACVEMLGAEFKETVVLVLGEGLSHKEAAEILDVKESTISWRIHKVRNKLHEFNPDAGGQT